MKIYVFLILKIISKYFIIYIVIRKDFAFVALGKLWCIPDFICPFVYHLTFLRQRTLKKQLKAMKEHVIPMVYYAFALHCDNL